MSVVVSIVIPLSKTSTIRETIESCLNQTMKEYEILLVDNNAPAETLASVHPFMVQHPGKIRVVSETRQGACSARNRGIIESHGEYVALLDDDDMMYPHRLEIRVATAEKHPEAAMIHAIFDRVSPDNRHVVNKAAGDTPEFWRKLLFEPSSPLADVPTVLPSIMFFRKETAIRAGLFDEQFNPECFEESEFCLRMSEQGPFICADETLGRYRTHSEMHRVARHKRLIYIIFRNLDRFYRILFNKYGFSPNSRVKKAFRIMRGQWLREVSFLLFPYQSGSQFAKYFVHRSLKKNPFDYRTWKTWLRAHYPMSLWPSAFHFDEWIEEALPETINFDFLQSIFQPVLVSFDTETSR